MAGAAAREAEPQASLEPVQVEDKGPDSEKATQAEAPAEMPARASAAEDGEVKHFFEDYLRCLLQLVVSADYEAAHRQWLSRVSPDFACVTPCGTTPGTEAVLPEWRLTLQFQHYSSMWMSNFSFRELESGQQECQATMVRRYEGHRGEDLMRDMLRLQVVADRDASRRLRVVRHAYHETALREIDGVRSNSQICQDFWVLDRLSKLQTPGFFLEVGANHAEVLSNSWLLEKARGWDGICIEPFPSGAWCDRRADLVKAAVGPEGGTLRFIAPGHVLGGLIDEVDEARVRAQVPLDQQQIVEVETRTMLSMLQSARPGGKEAPKVIHYMSLDTEGSEYSILCSFPFDQYTVLAITVEHNFKEPSRTQIRELLVSRGFDLDMCVEHDDFYLLRDYQRYLS